MDGYKNRKNLRLDSVKKKTEQFFFVSLNIS